MRAVPRSVSFVIPVRNDAARLADCLRAIRALGSSDDVEIVVADNGSTDDSAEVAQRAGARVLSLPDLRVGEVRNRAADVARGDILAFVDADNEIGAEWMAAALDALRDLEVGAAGAPYRSPSPATWVQRSYDGLRRHPMGRESVDWLGSGNMALRRSAFREVGGFDASLETCEDVDLCRKLRARGYALIADRRMTSVHHGDPETLSEVFFGELWRGRDNVRVSLRRPWSLRSLASAAMPVASLAATLAMVGSPLMPEPLGVVMALTGIGFLASNVIARAARIRQSASPTWSEALAVAAAYEAGRALALAGRFGYKRRRTIAAA
jgi:GT2 family glycosyltransferase